MPGTMPNADPSDPNTQRLLVAGWIEIRGRFPTVMSPIV